MTLDPTTLLAGPRGRRLCLEWALRRGESRPDTEALASAVYTATFNVGNGTVGLYTTGRFHNFSRWFRFPSRLPSRLWSRLWFRFPSHLLFRGPAALRAPFILPEPKGVADLLAEQPLTEPDSLALLQALGETVDSARYWQEPEPIDILAAAPDVTLALERVAAVIAASRPAANWTRPASDTQQWLVVFEYEGSARPDPTFPAIPKTAAESLDEWRERVIDTETRAASIRSISPESAHSGEWWSTPPALFTTTTGAFSNNRGPYLGESAGLGPVGLWLVEDGRGWERAIVMRLSVPTDARIFTIDGPDAWAQLCRRYPLEVTASRRHDWFYTTGRDGRWITPDWAAAQQDFDAVHLTIAGYLQTAGLAVALDSERASVLAGWSPDHTFWLQDIEADPLTAEDWVFNPAERRWGKATLG